MGDERKKSSRQMSTSLDRNKELTSAFNEGGKDVEKRRDRYYMILTTTIN